MTSGQVARREPGPGGKDASEVEECARLTEGLEEGGQRRAAALEALRGTVRRRSFEAAGCRTVQAALQNASSSAAADLVKELHGHVREGVSSPHANYVVQKIVEVMPSALSEFVAKELEGIGAAVARHRFGCRILCRLLEHAATSPGTIALVNEVLAEVPELSRHAFAHHVVSAVVEQGLPEQRHRVAEALCSDLPRYARNRNATYVIEKALTHCSPEDQRAITEGLTGDQEQLLSLAHNQFGSWAIRAALRLPGDVSRDCLARLQAVGPQLRGTRFGQRVVDDMHRLSSATASAAPAA